MNQKRAINLSLNDVICTVNASHVNLDVNKDRKFYEAIEVRVRTLELGPDGKTVIINKNIPTERLELPADKQFFQSLSEASFTVSELNKEEQAKAFEEYNRISEQAKIAGEILQFYDDLEKVQKKH